MSKVAPKPLSSLAGWGLGVLTFLALIGVFSIVTLLGDGSITRDVESCRRALAEADQMVTYGETLSDRWSSLVAADGFTRVADRYSSHAQACRESM
jgi:hypothetical protein